MDVKVTWQKEMQFLGLAESGFPVRMSSPSGPDLGVGPVEMTVMALAACTAMDVISILQKKQQRIAHLEVLVHAERAQTYPKVVSSAVMEYVVRGAGVQESALRRAIQLSVRQYCPVHAMLSKAFPIELRYSIYEGDAESGGTLVRQGRCDELEARPGTA